MAHSERASRLRTKLREFWSRRSKHGGALRGPISKFFTHRRERREARRIEREAFADPAADSVG